MLERPKPAESFEAGLVEWFPGWEGDFPANPLSLIVGTIEVGCDIARSAVIAKSAFSQAKIQSSAKKGLSCTPESPLSRGNSCPHGPPAEAGVTLAFPERGANG
jgi:hypothetical protein